MIATGLLHCVVDASLSCEVLGIRYQLLLSTENGKAGRMLGKNEFL